MDKSNSKMYINDYGDKIYRNSKGLLHRINGPAIDRTTGVKYWYKKGQWHRTDGPALEYSHRSKSWYMLDKNLKEKEFNSWIKRIKCFI